MKVAVTGTRGTLGSALVKRAEAAGHEVLPLNRPEYDITDPASVLEAVRRFEPEVVIHPAAYTNVDGAEDDPDTAFRVNGLGTRNVALACEQVGASLVYVSTNMVFFDESRRTPFTELETPSPLGAYAYSKWAGEKYVEHLMTRFYIARVSWLFGKMGVSFVDKIVKAADARGALSVVADEVATPTYAEDVAEALFKLAASGLYGWYHTVNEGEASRFEYAQEIMRLTGRAHIPMTPTSLADYKRPAPTPHYSTLKNSVGAEAGIALRPWQEALREYIAERAERGTGNAE